MQIADFLKKVLPKNKVTPNIIVSSPTTCEPLHFNLLPHVNLYSNITCPCVNGPYSLTLGTYSLILGPYNLKLGTRMYNCHSFVEYEEAKTKDWKRYNAT